MNTAAATITPDALYKKLFECLAIFLSLLRGGGGPSFRLPQDWIDRIDLISMESEATETTDLLTGERRADLLISFRLRPREGEDDAETHRVFFHIEFQSKCDPTMHKRMSEYIPRLLWKMMRADDGTIPVLFSFVVYTGEEKWTAPTHIVPLSFPFSPEEVARVTGISMIYRLIDIQGCGIEDLPGGEELACWIRLVRAKTREEFNEAIGEASDLLHPKGEDGENAMRLFLQYSQFAHWQFLQDANLDELLRVWREEGRNMATVIQSHHADRWLAEHDAEVRAAALEQGIEQGIEQARAEQRALLRDQAELRFDADTAQRLAELIEPINDSDRLSQIAEWIITCESSGEFLGRIANGHLPNGALNGESSG